MLKHLQIDDAGALAKGDGAGILAGEVAYVHRIRDAAIDADVGVLSRLIDEMRASSVTATTIAETYVPAVARNLGDLWDADQLDFSFVAVALTRLQALLWHLSPEWGHFDEDPSEPSGSILVVVPKGSQHTLGAMVLAGQLRHRGVATHLELEASEARFKDLAETKSYGAIMLSASAREPLEELSQLVQKARHAYPDTPILIGGSVLEHGKDVAQRTAADMATSDLDTALEYCGLGSLSNKTASARQVG